MESSRLYVMHTRDGHLRFFRNRRRQGNSFALVNEKLLPSPLQANSLLLPSDTFLKVGKEGRNRIPLVGALRNSKVYDSTYFSNLSRMRQQLAETEALGHTCVLT